jgi:two-component system CheB/CheR fusion protein
VDPRGATLATNPAYERFVESAGRNFAPLDLLGRAVPEEQWPQRRAARGESFDMEFAIRTRRGTYQWYEAVAEPLTFTDRSWGGVVTIRDISERTMRISLERLMAAASHELRTPLAALHGYVQLMERHLRQNGPESMSRYSAQALGQTRQIGALVDLLFDVSRVRSGQFTLDTEQVDLAGVVRHAADTVRAIAGAPPIKLSLPRSRVTVLGDPARLEQVIVNIIGNAVEHADTPRVAVSVRRSGDYVRIRIRDFGTGINPAALADLFEPFRPLQLREVSSTGMGLGLFLSREIVLAHRGSIDVSSTLGEGTVVTIALEVVDEPAREAGAAEGRS